MSHSDAARRPLPAVDERIVAPGSGAEIVQGELFMTPPADEPYGNRHAQLAYVLRAHIADGYLGAIDMLTRTSETSDFAPDASVYPAARDPATGGRQLEVLAFEVVSEQWIGVPSEKARELARRGVRWVFCLVLKTGRVLEWSRETDGWGVVSPEAAIEDEALARPLPVRALVDAAAADAAVVEALRRRGLLAPIERELKLEYARGLCEVLDVSLDADRRARLEALDVPGLDALIARLKRERRWTD